MRHLSSARAAILATALAAHACYSPTIGNGALLCGDGDHCPQGFTCAADRTCRKNGVRPTAPSQVEAFPDVRSALVSWFPPLDEGGSPVTRYTVTAAPGGAMASSLSTAATVEALADGTSYTFTVVAENALGKSAASLPSPPSPTPTHPGAPTAVVAVAGRRTATVSWTAPDTGGAPIHSYTVRSDPPDAASTQSTTSTTLFLLRDGTAYTFTVFATNAVGSGPLSAPSAPVTPTSPPGAPAIFQATAGVRSATLQFIPPDDGGSPITGYAALQSKAGGPFTPAAATFSDGAAQVAALDDGGSYRFELVATNAVGEGPASAPSEAVQLP